MDLYISLFGMQKLLHLQFNQLSLLNLFFSECSAWYIKEMSVGYDLELTLRHLDECSLVMDMVSWLRGMLSNSSVLP